MPRSPALDCVTFTRVAEQLLGCDGLVPIVVFPRQRSRRRLYVHLMSREGERIAFAKLSGDRVNDELLAREANALRRLVRSNVQTFRFPSLLAEGTFGDHRYILSAPLPAGAQQVRPRWNATVKRIRSELAGEERTIEHLRDASWWGAWERCVDASPALASATELQPGHPFQACGAHGDLVSWNIHWDGDENWVVDWEAYALDAPVLADELRFFLGIHTRAINADPSRGPRLVHERFGCGDDEQRSKVLRALAFLQTRNVLAALIVGAHWPELDRP